jgi:hypothetical protein
MTIDASLPFRAGTAGQFNLGDIAGQAERVRALRGEEARRQWEMEQQQAEAQRQAGARGSLAELILSQSPGMPGQAPQGVGGLASLAGTGGDQGGGMSPGGVPNNMQVRPESGPATAPQAAAPNPWADYVRLDPEGAIDFRASTADWQKESFDIARDLNAGVMQILGSVHDQASFVRAKNKARALYGRHGLNLDDFDLPAEYSPELIRSLQMEGMETSQQLDAIRRERETEWNIEDDRLDNERMDEREADLASDREARRNQTGRIAERRDATTRRGQDRAPAGRRSGQARPTATGPNGQKVEWDGKAWVPVGA